MRRLKGIGYNRRYMPKYIAFLRAINVGGHVVKMNDLKKLFEKMGFSNVSTFIASGNVIFDSASKNRKALEKKIEDSLEKGLGYPVATFVRTTEEVARVLEQSPFKNFESEEKLPALFIGFVADPPENELGKKLKALSTKTDELLVQGSEIYWLCHSKLSDSKLSYAVMEKVLGVKATFRNCTTVRRIALLCNAG